MIIRIILSIILLSPSFSFAENSSNLSIGIGVDQGGLGVKYATGEMNSRFFASVGLLSFTESSAIFGYGIGWEKSNIIKNSSLGIFLGTVRGKLHNNTFVTSEATYYGGSITYNYYFTSFTESSFVAGISLDYGRTNANPNLFEETESGASIKLAYQW